MVSVSLFPPHRRQDRKNSLLLWAGRNVWVIVVTIVVALCTVSLGQVDISPMGRSAGDAEASAAPISARRRQRQHPAEGADAEARGKDSTADGGGRAENFGSGRRRSRGTANDEAAEHSREEETSAAVRYASSVNDRHGYVLIQMFNSGFVEMTKSWICNVRRYDGVLERTVFVATDREAYDAIESFGGGDEDDDGGDLHVFLEPYDSPKAMTFGRVDYYAYMLFRTNFLVTLLDRNVTTWLVEADAVWLDDPTPIVLGTKGDMVTMNDGSRDTRSMGNGGFQLLRPTPATKTVWHTLQSRQMEAVASSRDRARGGAGGGGPSKPVLSANEQHLMRDIRNEMKGRQRTGWLPVDKFIAGTYYSMKGPRPESPVVILNNWLVLGSGSRNEAKIQRAKEWGHWFLDDDGSCIGERAKAKVTR